MVQAIISTAISCIVSMALGFCISKIKEMKSKQSNTDKALLTLIQNTLTNTYFVYEQMQKIPDYIYKNWLNLLKVYEALGGNDYIHILAKKMEQWEITKTDILGK